MSSTTTAKAPEGMADVRYHHAKLAEALENFRTYYVAAMSSVPVRAADASVRLDARFGGSNVEAKRHKAAERTRAAVHAAEEAMANAVAAVAAVPEEMRLAGVQSWATWPAE